MDIQIVTVIEDDIELVEVSGQGPQGPTGPPGSAGAVSYRAATALSGHVAIALDSNGDAIAADPTNALHANVVGLTSNAAVLGDNVQVVSRGFVEHLGWTLTPGQPVFLGPSGSIVQTVPGGAAFTKVLGFALAPTRMNIDLQPAIF